MWSPVRSNQSRVFCILVHFALLSRALPVKQWAVWIDSDNPSSESTLNEFKSLDEFLLATLNSSVMIASDSTVYLLHTDHYVTVNLQKPLTIKDITNLSIEVGLQNEAENPYLMAGVFCHTMFGLSFINITNLRMFGIHFEQCGVVSNSLMESTFVYTLKVANSFYVLIHNVSISNSAGIGLHLQNVYSYLSLSYLRLKGNALNCYIQCCWLSDSTITEPTSYVVEHSNISFGESCNKSYCNSSSSGLTVLFNQTSFPVSFGINNVTLLGNRGQGNIQINTTSCCLTNLITITHVKSGAYYALLNYGIVYHELQCIHEVSHSLTRNVTVSHSHFKQSCIYGILHDNMGLKGGVSETHITLQNTSISSSSCRSSLEVHNIHYVTLNYVVIKSGRSPYILRAVNELSIKTSYYSIRFLGYCTFKNNTGGISIIGDQDQLQRTTKLEFTEESRTVIKWNKVLNNTDNQFGTTLFINNVVIELRYSSLKFVKNRALVSGGITAIRSDISFIGNSDLEFDGNHGRYGGAIALYEKSTLSFYRSNATITFTNNSASYYGGAVFVDDSSYLERITNIFIAPFFSLFCCSPRLVFRMNKAGQGGSALYGGWIDWVNYFLQIEANISHFFYIEHQEGDHSPIASDPTRICVCQNGKPNCSLTEIQVNIHPGESFSIMATAVGQRFGTVTSRVEAKFDEVTEAEETTRPQLGELERIQIVEQRCTLLKYSPRSSNSMERLLLTVSNMKNILFADKTVNELDKDPVYHLLFKQLSIKVDFQPCPFGFQFNKTTKLCICKQLPTSYNIYCDPHEFKLIRQDTTWVGISTDPGIGDNASSTFIIGICPFDFCHSSDVILSLEDSDSDAQCNFNRSGVLCGGCKQNYSMVFGSSACLDCSNGQIAPLLVGFALAGVGLIALLLTLNLTISSGTINSLIFYANTVSVSTWSFIPTSFSHSFLYRFVSVLNLGIGIETCFYNGMSAYEKAWIFFAFPSYILTLSILIIIVSHYSIRASRLLGRNPVQVLATLFMLSYAKFLEITVATSAFGFSTLQSADSRTVHIVWILDGNVAYLGGKHALLFIASSLLVVFVCIPYTILLAFIQPLRKYSHIRVFRWIHKLKPFIDAHTGPYKHKHQYWTGLLLLVRAGLVFLFTLNRHGNQLINATLLAMVTLCLIFYILLVRGVYRSRLLNTVEISFLINLFILSIALLLQDIFKSHNQKLSLWTVNISVGFAFLYLCFILIYHTAVRISNTLFGKWVNKVFIRLKQKVGNRTPDNTQGSTNDSVPNVITHSSFALRETLLLNDD